MAIDPRTRRPLDPIEQLDAASADVVKAHPQMKTQDPGGAKVTVACKLPSGLELQLYDMKPGPDGVPVAEAAGDPVVLAGSNAENQVGGYGFTTVNAAFFAEWMKQNANYPAVKRGLIFAHDRPDMVAARAAEQAALTTGFEGVNPEAPKGGVQPENYQGKPPAP